MGLRANRLYPLISRTRDVFVASLALLLFAPAFPVIGLLARRSTGGSALFHQVRVGRDGKHFTVQKLRTLPVDAPANVSKRQAEHLARPLGQFMRRFKLDELPQFWNVLRGDMSLVGPRPIIPAEYSDGEQPLRLVVRPGLTGLWQLSRVRAQPFDKSPEYDLFYLANRSTVFDLWLVWRTVLLILRGRETKIRLAAQLWERNSSWRKLAPDRARSIPPRKGLLRSRLYAIACLGAAVLIVLPGIGLAVAAKNDLLDARRSLTNARRSTAALDPAAASAELERAENSFRRAASKLASWPTLPLRVVPGLNNNLEVPKTFAALGSSLVDAGKNGLKVLEALPSEGGRLAAPLNNGTMDIAPFVQAEAPARTLQAQISSAQRQLGATPKSFLLPPVAEARSQAISLLSEARSEADTAVGAAFLIPRLFGADGPRRWIIGAENSSELRGRGGYMGSIGILSADLGTLQLADFQPTSGLPALPDGEELDATMDQEFVDQYLALGGSTAWQNLLMSPDFPTGAQNLLTSLETVANIPGDGLIAVDPVALSYLMRATGPIDVPGIPERLTSENIVAWSLNKIYLTSGTEPDERKELLSVIASSVWNRLLTNPNLNPQVAAGALGQALSERHMVLYSSRRDEQRVIEQLGIGGSLDQTENDYLLLVSQNVAENKMDYYLDRKISYSGSIQQDGSLDVQVKTTVTNTAPAGAQLPTYVAGEHDGLGAGKTRNFMSLFVPLRAQLSGFVKNGSPSDDFESSTEKGRRRLATYLQVAPGESATFAFKYRIPDALVDGRYQLSIQNQATVRPDEISIQIRPPKGALVSGQSGFRPGDGLTWEGKLKTDLSFSARVEAPLGSRLKNRLIEFLHQPVASASRSLEGPDLGQS